MRDSTIDSNKYFRFGNPEYLLDKFQFKINQQDIDMLAKNGASFIVSGSMIEAKTQS